MFSWTNKHNTKKSETNSISWVRSQILQRTPESADVRAKIARLSSFATSPPTDSVVFFLQCQKCKVQSAMKSPIFKVVLEHEKRSGVDVSDISVYICLIDIRDGSSKPVYGGVDCLMIGTDSYAYLWYTM